MVHIRILRNTMLRNWASTPHLEANSGMSMWGKGLKMVEERRFRAVKGLPSRNKGLLKEQYLGISHTEQLQLLMGISWV